MILGLLVAVTKKEDAEIDSGCWMTHFEKVPSWILEENHPDHGDPDQLPTAVLFCPLGGMDFSVASWTLLINE